MPGKRRPRVSMKFPEEKRRDFKLQMRANERARQLVDEFVKHRHRISPEQRMQLQRGFAFQILYAWKVARESRYWGEHDIQRKAISDRFALREEALKHLLEARGFKNVQVVSANSPENVFGDVDTVSITIDGKSRPDLEAIYGKAFKGFEAKFVREMDKRGRIREPTRKVVGLRARTQRYMQELISNFNRMDPDSFKRFVQAEWGSRVRKWYQRPEHRAYFIEWVKRNSGRLKRQMIKSRRKEFKSIISIVDKLFEE